MRRLLAIEKKLQMANSVRANEKKIKRDIEKKKRTDLYFLRVEFFSSREKLSTFGLF